MAEPARQFDEDEELSAQERADQAWGNSEPSDSAQGVGYKSPLEQAREKWGSADVIGNEDQERQALADTESSGSSQRGSAASQEQSSVGTASGVDINSMNYSGSENSEGTQAEAKSRGVKVINFLTKRSSIAGLVGGGSFGALLIAGFISAQPFQVVHFAQLLQQFHFMPGDESDNGRLSKLVSWARTIDSPERRNLGFAGNKIADRYQGKLSTAGFDPSFANAGGGNGRYITGFTIDPETPTGKSALGDLQAQGVDLDGLEREGKLIKVDLKGRGSSAEARRVIRASVDAMGENKIASAMSKRLLIKRAGVGFHPLTNLKRKVSISLGDFTASVREKVKERRNNGSPPESPGLKSEGEADAEGDTDADKTAKAEAATEGATAASEGNAAAELAQGAEPKATKVSGVQEKLGKGAAAIGILCAVKGIGDRVDEEKYIKVILPLMRTGMDVVSTGSQVMYSLGQKNSDVSLDELGVLNKDFYDVSKKMGWSSAKSFQAELGQEQTGPDIPETARPSFGEKNLLFKTVDQIFDASFGVANAACSKLGQFLMSAITPIQTAIQEGALALSRSIFGTDPLQIVAGWAVDILSGDEVNTAAVGPDLGNIANYGTRLAANDIEIPKGGTALSPAQSAELRRDRDDDLVAQVRAKSLFARLFDLKEPRSVASVALLQSGNFATPQSLVASLKNAPLAIFTGSAQNIAKITTPRVFAQESTSSYDYGFAEFGFTKTEQEDPRFEDPYANAAIVEPQLAALNDKYGQCHTMTVNPETGALEFKEGQVAKPEDIAKNPSCKDGSEILQRYRFYLKDMVGKKVLLCRSGIDEASCKELGFNDTSTNTETPAQTTKPIAGDTFDTPCAAGTTDLSGSTPAIGYQDDKPYNIRICTVPGIKSTDGKLTAKVNSVSSKNFLDLSNAATAAGHPLVFNGEYSTFRTMEQQEFLCNDNPTSCAQGFTAKPGTSNHQMGFAIDFNFDGYGTGSDALNGRCKTAKAAGKRCELGESATWVWMRDHAAEQGISQLEFEFWHWGTNEASF